MGIKMFKEKTQRALGSNNRQSQGNKAKAKNGAKIYQNAGDVINGIPPEDLEKWFNELKGQISINNEKLQSSIEKSIESVLVSKVAKIVMEAYKAHCESCSPDEKLALSLDQIKSKADNMTSDIQKVITNLQDAKNAAKEIKSELNESRKQIEAEITSLSRLCEDILHNVKLAKEILGEKIDDCKELISKFMQEAELRNKELLNTIQRVSSKGSNEEENELEAYSLDLSTLAKMFDVIKEINEKQTTGESVDELIVNSVNEVNIRCKQIQSDIGKIRECTDEGYKKADEILHLTREGNEGVKEANNKLEVLQRQLNEVNDKLNKISTEYQAVANCQAKMDSAISNDEREKLVCELEKLRTQLNETLQELEIATSTGEMSPILPCRYCGFKAERKIIGGECVCTVCGHRYHLDPNISEITNKQIETDIQRVCTPATMDKENKRVVAWKELHTAELEEVSTGVHSGLYRMKLDKYTVSSNGVLIIPNKTWDRKDEDKPNITEIAFCQPNTYDKEGMEQLSRVRTLFLSEGIKVTEYDGEKPFSKIKSLEKIMKWDGNGYVVDEELSPQSKRIVS